MEKNNQKYQNTTDKHNMAMANNDDIFNIMARWVRSVYKDKHSFAATALTFLLGLTPMSVGFNPFGVAFFFASMLPTAPMAVGLFFSAAASGLTAPMPMICATLGALFRIKLAKKGKLGVVARIILSSTAGLIGGLLRIPFVDGEVGEPLRTILLAISVPLFCGILLGLNRKTAVFGAPHEVLARLAMLFCGVRLLSVVTVGKLSLGIIAAAGAVLYLSYLFCKYEVSRPSPSCCAVGCIVGFVCGIATGDVSALPMLGLLGLCAGFLFPLHELTALICAPIGAILFSTAAVDAIAGLVTFIHVTVGIGVYVLLRRIPTGDWIKELFVRERKSNGPHEDKKLSLIEESFSSLSKALKVLDEYDVTRRAVITELPLCCADCNGCFSHGINEFEMRQAMNGYLNDSIPIKDYMIKCCPNAAELRSSLEFMSSQADNVISQTASRYEEFSRILSSLREQNELEDTVDTVLSLELSESLTRMGLNFSHARVYGTRLLRAQIYDVHLNEMECSSNTLMNTVSSILDRQVSEPLFIVNDECVSMSFETVPQCRVETSMMTTAKEGEVTNGDTVATFESTNGMSYALIGDGMGSGESAAVCSRMGAILIEKLILLGSDKDEVLRLLNKILLSKGDEVFTTVDLLSLDRLTMDVELTKAGAAPTYLIRGGEVTMVGAKSAPLGLIDDLCAKRQSFKANHGDVIVMMSDGAYDGDSAPEWIREYFKSTHSESCAIMTAKLMELAKTHANTSDDVSIIVVRVC